MYSKNVDNMARDSPPPSFFVFIIATPKTAVR